MGFDWTFAVNGYGDKWRKRRRAFHGQMHQGIAPIYQGVQMREARVFHKQLLDDTDDIPGLARRLGLLSLRPDEIKSHYLADSWARPS